MRYADSTASRSPCQRPAVGLEQEQPDGSHGDPVAVAQHGDRGVLAVSGVQVGLGEDCLLVDEDPVANAQMVGAFARRPHAPAHDPAWPAGRTGRRTRGRGRPALRASAQTAWEIGTGRGPICRRAWTLCSPEHAWHRAQPALATSESIPRSLM